MVKFRSNHARSKSNASILRLIVLSLLFVLLMYWMVKPAFLSVTDSFITERNISPAYYIPDGPSGKIIYRDKYSYALDSIGCVQWIAFDLRKKDILEEDLNIEDYQSERSPKLPASKNKLRDSNDCVALPWIRQYKEILSEEVEYFKDIEYGPVSNDFMLLFTDFENWVSDLLSKKDFLILISGSNSTVAHTTGGKDGRSIFYVILDPTPGMEKSIALNIPIQSDYGRLKDYFLPVEELEQKTPWLFFTFYLENSTLEKTKRTMKVQDWY
ncbi:MAG TPA: hypothetical protein PKC30_10845 [Saprospiraceae bacterium]|nr:hypothetical protein [Saprospiraceae bacterium]